MHGTEKLREAERLMTVCNSCRYCEGLCAVFPAMELRRSFSDGDLHYLANLCHNCGACYVDCQFSPPHEFAVNVPKVLAEVRADSFGRYAWPGFLRPLFKRNGLSLAVAGAVGIAAFFLGVAGANDPAALLATDGQFYRLMPHTAMASLFTIAGLYALLALLMGVRNFWKDIGSFPGADLGQAVKDSASLRYLDGGGEGCYNDEAPADRRRLFHHFTFYGFLLCFAATCVATLYDYLLAMSAPYAWYQLPKLLGTAGGIALVIGTVGLLREKTRRDPAIVDEARRGMDTGFIAILFATGFSGLLLLLLQNTSAMAILLCLHLGTVCALLLTLPYSKFVHGFYRFTALARYAAEKRSRSSAQG